MPVVAADLLAASELTDTAVPAGAGPAEPESDVPASLSTGAGCSGSVLLPGAGCSIQDTVEPSEYCCTALKVSSETPSGSLPAMIMNCPKKPGSIPPPT